jgi:hypothetical protein
MRFQYKDYLHLDDNAANVRSCSRQLGATHKFRFKQRCQLAEFSAA